MKSAKLLLITLIMFSVSKADLINVVGEAEGEYRPDYAIMIIGGVARKATSDSAIMEVEKIADKLIALTNKFGVDSSDVSSNDMIIKQEHDRERDEKGTFLVFKGYEAVITYRIRINDLSIVSPLVNACLSSGINKLESIDFYHSKKDSLKRVLYAEALKNAEKSARALCKQSGRKLKGLVKASYDKPDDFDVNLYKWRKRRKWGDLMGHAAESKIPVLPSPVLLNVKIYASYKIK